MNISTTEMTREQWLLARKQGIGSSDVGKILGLSKYGTAYDVYIEKTSESVLDEPMNKYMEFGIKLEDVIAETYAERNSRNVLRDDVIRVHPDYPFMMANLDRLIVPMNGEGNGILEIKTASGHAVRNWETDVPLEYFAQLSHQFFVTGLNWGAFALLVDGRDYSDISMKPDFDYIKMQNQMLFKFWHENVLAKVPPTPTVADLEKLKPTEGASIEANEEIADLCTQLSEIKAIIKTKDAAKEEIEDRLKEFIGLNEVAIHNGITLFTWKSQHRKAYQVEEKDFRVLKLSTKKER